MPDPLVAGGRWVRTSNSAAIRSPGRTVLAQNGAARRWEPKARRHHICLVLDGCDSPHPRHDKCRPSRIVNKITGPAPLERMTK